MFPTDEDEKATVTTVAPLSLSREPPAQRGTSYNLEFVRCHASLTASLRCLSLIYCACIRFCSGSTRGDGE